MPTISFAQDTIAAIVTPPGRGGIGVISFSGPLALQLATPILRSKRPLVPGKVRYSELLDPTNLRAGTGLLVSTGAAFRSLVQDSQIDIRFPAWADGGLALYFCQTDYGGWKQCLKGCMEDVAIPICWTPGVQVHACPGF